jgi:hypothetical protein
MKRGIALVLVLIVLLTPLGVYAASMPSYAVSYDHTLSTGLRYNGSVALDLGYGWLQAQFVGPLPWMDAQILIQNHRVSYMQFAYRSSNRPQITQRFTFVNGKVVDDRLDPEGRLLLFMLLANFWPEGFPPDMADDPLLLLGIWLGSQWR